MMTFALWLEDPGSLSSGNSRLLMIFVAMVAVAMVAQAVAVIAAVIAAAKARKQLLSIAEEVRAKSLPVIDGAQFMVQDLQPKFRMLADNLVNRRARNQTARVDDMFTSVLDSTEGIASTVQKTVSAPVREFHGIMNGLKAGFDVLTGRRENHHRANSSYSDYPDHLDPDGVTGPNPFGSGAKPYSKEGEPPL